MLNVMQERLKLLPRAMVIIIMVTIAEILGIIVEVLVGSNVVVLTILVIVEIFVVDLGTIILTKIVIIQILMLTLPSIAIALLKGLRPWC